MADKYIAAFREDVSALGVKPATRHPRVVEFMADIIRFVEDLVDKGYAYESEGDVYFRVEKSHNYAKLANKTLADLELGASGRTDEEWTLLSGRQLSQVRFLGTALGEQVVRAGTLSVRLCRRRSWAILLISTVEEQT